MSEIDQFVAAIEAGHRDTIERMLGDDATLAHACDSEGATALHAAAFHGRQDVVDLLLKAGADINARDKEYNATPAGWAIHYLREHGALLAIEIEDVRFAIERGEVAWVERLVARHPALVRATDRDGNRLADLAAGQSTIAEIFSRYSSDQSSSSGSV